MATSTRLLMILPVMLVCGLQQLASAGPGVVIYPKQQVVYVDMKNPASKELTCQSEGDEPSMFSGIKWSGPNRRNNWEELAKRHIIREEEKDNNIWYLQFINPSHEDSGIYYCRGNHNSDSHEASINVTFYTPIELRNCPKRQSIVLGSTNSKVHCNIIAEEPRVTIQKNNRPLKEYQNRYRWDDSEHSLVINGEVEESDAGVYSIIVRSRVFGEKMVENINVEVNIPPRIEPFTGTGPEFVGVEGEQATLKCNVTGKPQPLVYWLDPQKRNLTSRGGYIVNLEQGTVLIEKVKKVDDHGFFECHAYNAASSDKRRVSMEVVTRPTIVSFENKTAVEREEVIFECRSTGYPEPTFSIRRHGNNQQPYQRGDALVKDMYTRPEGGGSDVFVHTLKITADRSLFGAHYCNVTNRAGTAERSAHLTVAHKPDLSATSPIQYVKLGRPSTFICHIKAFPLPTVNWFIDNVQVTQPKSNIATEPDGYTHVVTMMPPQPFAFQKLTCRASNTQGVSEQIITPLVVTKPGPVIATLVNRTPTTIQFALSVTNEGGDRIKFFKYSAEGRSMDEHNPLYHYRVDRHNETFITASPDLNYVYTIKNLLPYYRYTIRMRAVNDVDEGDMTDISVETIKPTRPEPPVIMKSNLQKINSGYLSDYSNGFTLRWSPPELDNGDPVTRYILKFNKITSDSLDISSDVGYPRIIEQMPDRPMFFRVGPLESNQRYRIRLQAENKIAPSKEDEIIIQTRSDLPSMPESGAMTLAWLTEPSTQTYAAILALGLLGLLVTDLVFCFCFQMGISHKIRTCCCPIKTNSVISDKTYT